jgi:hypothetical protein
VTDWLGTGTPIVVTPTAIAPDCVEYLSVAAIRAEYGDDVTDSTDAALQRQIDQMVAYLEDQLGHTFGRSLIARSTSNDAVSVSATRLTIGGDEYLFATYPTLLSLVTAVNDAGDTYTLELLPQVRTDTPSTLLKTHALTLCGPDYENRVVLCQSAMYCVFNGRCQSHLFLPLSLASIVEVVQNGTALVATDYWAVPGESWIVRKVCGCGALACYHVHGVWSAAYHGNISVTFIPTIWGRVPASLSAQLLDAFSARGGLAPYQSENFGDYSYKRHTAEVATWQELLGGSTVRPYVIRFHP